MTAVTATGAALLVALVLYALLGGADYGGGIWDLLASGPRRREQRALVERALGPIWEANHVWLVLAVVVFFTGFPAGFAAVSTTLFLPLTLLLVGVVLRGSAFVFRAHAGRGAGQAVWGLVFSASSVVAPLALGAMVGALASGRLRVGPDGAPLSPPLAWLSPFSAATGLLAVVTFAFLAAVYLTVEAGGALREDFRARALAAGGATFVAALSAALLSRQGAPLVFEGLTSRPWSLPLHVGTGAAAVGALWSLWRRRFSLARVLAATQVGLIVVGWGAALHPFLVVPDVTLASAAAPRRTLVLLLAALAAGAPTLLPSLWLLFRVFKGRPRST